MVKREREIMLGREKDKSNQGDEEKRTKRQEFKETKRKMSKTKRHMEVSIGGTREKKGAQEKLLSLSK